MSLPRMVFVVLRRDDDSDTPIAVYDDKEAAELHVKSASRAVSEVIEQYNACPHEEEEALLKGDFPWDVDTDNDYVVNWSPTYSWEEVLMAAHPDQFQEVQDGVCPLAKGGAGPDQAWVDDALSSLEQILADCIWTNAPNMRGRIEALIKRARGES